MSAGMLRINARKDIMRLRCEVASSSLLESEGGRRFSERFVLVLMQASWGWISAGGGRGRGRYSQTPLGQSSSFVPCAEDGMEGESFLEG